MDAAISQTTAPFTYDTLPDAVKYIRLLEVLDDGFFKDTRVRCRITTWPVDNKPSYYAISYTWGDPEPSSTILINGQAFRIRTNCEFVLKQAYWYKKTSYYWVDAICINQRHLEEKSMQVSIMGNIYKQAAQVLACVGDHADDSDFLLYKLKQHAFSKRPLSREPLNIPRYDFELSLKFQLRQRFSNTIRFLHAAFFFLKRPYFTRLWILQEIQNAREATFLCGPDAIPRHFIFQMSGGLRYYLEYWLGASRLRLIISSRLLIFRSHYIMRVFLTNHRRHTPDLYFTAKRAWYLLASDHDLETLIRAAGELNCQEWKDKVFGLISLIDWGISGPLIPDYTQTEFEVAVNFVKHLLNASYHGGNRPHKAIAGAISQVAHVLELGDNSPGVPSAIEARRLEPGICLANEDTNLEHIPFEHSVWRGWRVSSGHLTKTESRFSTWILPESDLGKVFLPFWVLDDDWIVLTSVGYPMAFVLVREVVEGLGGPLIGHAFPCSDYLRTMKTADAEFRIHWDPEDLVIYSIMQEQWRESKSRALRLQDPNPAELVGALNTAICRKEAPGSSYALRQH